MRMLTSKDIKELRAKLGMSLTAFGYGLGVSAGAVASWEAGRRFPKHATMVKLIEMAEKARNRGKVPPGGQL